MSKFLNQRKVLLYSLIFAALLGAIIVYDPDHLKYITFFNSSIINMIDLIVGKNWLLHVIYNLTRLNLIKSSFKCAWFDEDDYFGVFPCMWFIKTCKNQEFKTIDVRCR